MDAKQLRNIIKEEIQNVLKEFDLGNVEPHNDFTNNIKHRSENYLYTVKNDAQGIQQIKKTKEALKGIYTLHLRGRHHDRKEVLGTEYRPGTQNDVPIKQAEYIAVYVR